MKVMKKPWAIPLIVTIVILVAGGLYIGSLLTKEKPLSNEEIRSQLENMYEGTVDSLSMKNGVYVAELTRAGALYSAEVDEVTGKVLSLVQLSEMEVASPKVLSEKEARDVIAKKYPGEVERISLNKNEDPPVFNIEVEHDQSLVTVVLDAFSGELISEDTKEIPAKNVLITRDEAIEIALKQLQGEVDHVSFEQTDDGGYYLVEIEQDNDDSDDVEAVFQIHAITGEIVSVDWDD